MKIKYLTVLLIFALFMACQGSHSKNDNNSPSTESANLHLEKIKLPPGFHISVFASHVDNARELALGSKNIVFVGSIAGGNVYAVRYDPSTYKATKVYTIANDLNFPNGVAYKNGDLYVGEMDKIIRYKNIEANLDHPPAPEVIDGNLRPDKHHGYKYIAFGPDGKLYIPQGMPCNICKEDTNTYGIIHRINDDGSGDEVIERGIRNSVGFSWHPITHELWFTDNGRDNLGDDIPPDELNYAPRKNMNFGFPYCAGHGIVNPEYASEAHCERYTSPAQDLGPHVASLGMKFYTGNQFPTYYHNQIFIAEHGSWNRTVPIGYRVTMVTLNSKYNGASSYKVFAEGWLQNGKPWGRPVDVLNMPDGSILVSDDFAGVVYRIYYTSN